MKKIAFYLFVCVLGNLSYGQILRPIDQDDDCLICFPDITVILNGATSASVNTTHTYGVFVSGGNHVSSSYTVSGGTITSQNKNSVTVRWTSVGSSRWIQVNASVSGSFYSNRRYVTVTGPPSTPSSPSISSNNCGNKTLTRGNPPSGVTWYWQTSSNGTSTGNSSSTYTVTSSRTVYLRARSNSSGLWSSSRSTSVTVKAIPGRPSTPTISSNSCGTKTVTRGNPPSGVTWYWQTSSGGTSTSNSSSTYSVSSSRTVYLRARSSNGCWSSVRSVSVSVNQAPSAPPTPSVTSNSCGAKILSVSSGGPGLDNPIDGGQDQIDQIGDGPPLGVTWYWQGTNSNGTSTSNSNSTYSANSSGTYYIRARNGAGCWSSSRSINVTVGVIPGLPSTPSISTNNCGNKTLTRSNPPSGVTWYWQTSSNGTSTSNSSATYSVPSTRTVYLRGRSLSGCWGSSRSVTVSVKPNPSTPSAPSISSNSCGNKTLTRGNPPSGVTWYWQTSSSGTSTTNSSSTYSVSSSRTVYLRARSSNGCWSGVRTVTVTVKPTPAMPSTPTVSTNNCGNKTLTRGNPPSGVTWYWQTSSNGTSTSNSSATYSVSSSRTMYLRARSSNGCWSGSRSVGVTVNQAPSAPPTPSVTTNSCGAKILSVASGGPGLDNPIDGGQEQIDQIDQIGDGPPPGVTWYWQGTNSNGTSTSNSNSTYSANSSGTYYIRARNGAGCWSSSTSINVTVGVIPGTPSTPSVSTNNCGNKTLTRSNPPSGVTWYWQTSSNGVSTTNSSATYSVSSTRTVYLRGRSSSGCWGNSRSISVSVKPIPSIPSSPSISSNSCGNKTLTRATPPSGVTWYWQTSSTGTSTTNASSTYIVSSSRTVYLRGKSSNGCWGSSRSVSVTVNPMPAMPAAPVVSNNTCGSKTVTRDAPPTGVTWYWQTSSSGTSTGNSSLTYTVYSSRTVYLRALGSNGCWSNSRSVGVSINEAPLAPPEPTVSANSCGSKILTIPNIGPGVDEQPIETIDEIANDQIDGGPPTGVTWYWQGTNATGESTNYNAVGSYTANSSGTYYVRALNSTGCWSLPRSVDVIVNPIPGPPTAPSISDNSCGNKTLTRGNPPSGVTWYWQTTSTGQVTTNSSPTYTVSSTRTVYLRARSTAGCWGSARTVNVTVNAIPAQPPAPYVSNNTCGDRTLSFTGSMPEFEDPVFEGPDGVEGIDNPIDPTPPLAPPSGVTWYWQGTDSNGFLTTQNANQDYVVTNTGTYYVRARSNSGCWSTIKSVSVTINDIPTKPSMPTVSPNYCGNKTLTRGTPPTGVTWYWQSSINGQSTTNSSETYTVTSSETMYLRARSAGGCWSDSRGVGVTVNPIPDMPMTPFVSTNTCGNKTLSLPFSGPDNGGGDPDAIDGADGGHEQIDPEFNLPGVSWYWQGTNANGESIDNPTSSPFVVSSSGTYYVRAQSGAGCWSASRSVAVTVNHVPAMPSSIQVSGNACGNKTLTRGTPPSGVTWYWQTSATGESRDSSAETYPVTSSRTVYLRARSSAGCWSSGSRSVAVTIKPVPNMPPSIAASINECGSKILTLNNLIPVLENDQPVEPGSVFDDPIDPIPVGPPEGVNWYWQGTDADGVSTTHPWSTAYEATTSGTYYVRALNDQGCWSNSRGLDVIVNEIPGIPAAPSISANTCGAKTLTRGTPPDGVTWFWQGKNSNGESDTNSAPTYQATSSGTYYIRARGSGDCWGASRAIPILIKPPSILASKTHFNNATPIQLSTDDTCVDALEWLLDGMVIGTGSSIEINQPGTYTLQSGDFSSQITITSQRTFWARSDGDWDNQIWALSESGAIVSAYPAGNDRVHIKGQSVTARGNQTCSYIYVQSANSPSLLHVMGNLEVNEEVVIEGQSNAEVKIDSGANLKVE